MSKADSPKDLPFTEGEAEVRLTPADIWAMIDKERRSHDQKLRMLFGHLQAAYDTAHSEHETVDAEGEDGE